MKAKLSLTLSVFLVLFSGLFSLFRVPLPLVPVRFIADISNILVVVVVVTVVVVVLKQE